MLSTACASVALLSAPASAATIVQTGVPFAAPRSVNTGNFNKEDDRLVAFNRFDASLGTLTGVALDYDLSANLDGAFTYSSGGGGWNANSVIVIVRDEGMLDREDGDGDGNGGSGSGSDTFDLSAMLSGTANASSLGSFSGEGQTDMYSQIRLQPQWRAGGVRRGM